MPAIGPHAANNHAVRDDQCAMRSMLTWVLLCGCHGAPPSPSVDRLTGCGPDLELVRIATGRDGQAFWIGRFEVTNAQFAAFVAATGYDGGGHPSSKPTEPFLGHFQDGRPPAGAELHPVCNLNLHHARAYCRWLSERTGWRVRLPTDAEWELAATGGTDRVYPWGDEWDPMRCNWGSPADGFATSAPVGSFPAGTTVDGVHDMAGNIWEWTEAGTLRGGPWCMNEATVRCAVVAREDVDRADDKFGLRVVVDG